MTDLAMARDEVGELREEVAALAADLRALRRITAPSAVIGFAGLLLGGISGIGWMAIAPIEKEIAMLAANTLPKEYILEKFNQAEKERLALRADMDGKAEKTDLNRVIVDMNRAVDVINDLDHKLREVEIRGKR